MGKLMEKRERRMETDIKERETAFGMREPENGL